MSENAPVTPEELSFGDALSELESIVGALESGSLELEDSLGRYGRGVELLKTLQSRLRDAQQKVTMLLGELEAEAGDEEGTE
ncbi:MAG TPA: exodeoxyribonuclease VII small subunit [Coriobacteriia bacterium]|nr:exodeoxyribonuclease VII small subunit [Coriobacteriia bacterium]